MSSDFASRATLVLVITCAGCTAPGPVFPPPETPLNWPPAPEPARIAYVGELSTDADLGAPRSFGEVLFGDEDIQDMQSPFAVCTEGDRVFVTDSGAAVVHVFDLESRAYARWRPLATNQRVQLLGAAWDSTRRRLLVADGAGACVRTWGADGAPAADLGAGTFLRPSGLALDPARDLIYVADTGAHAIVVLDGDGTERRRIGARGGAPGQFNYPTHLAVDTQGRLYVADSLNFRVQVFDSDGGALAVFGRHGDRPGFFAQPKGLALDRDDHLYVVDAQFEAVQVFDDAGQLLVAFGHEGHGPGEFWLPAGVHIDAKDRIWIADSYNRRVQVFQYLGEGNMTP